VTRRRVSAAQEFGVVGWMPWVVGAGCLNAVDGDVPDSVVGVPGGAEVVGAPSTVVDGDDNVEGDFDDDALEQPAPIATAPAAQTTGTKHFTTRRGITRDLRMLGGTRGLPAGGSAHARPTFGDARVRASETA
jgi:hypothetical protein